MLDVYMYIDDGLYLSVLILTTIDIDRDRVWIDRSR
jgi:hypothetical protein